MKYTILYAATLLLATAMPGPIRAAQDAPAAVSSAIQQALTALSQYQQAQQAAGLQDPNIACSMRKAIVLADLLIDSTGQLNVSLCPSLKAAFIPANPLEYEVDMARVLDQLDSSWQPFFDAISAPADHSLSSLLLRALFSMQVSDTITDRHAKMGVLAAMLSPYNQGPVGDCFAVAEVITDHEEFYQHAANDYAEMVQKGYLTRSVNGQPDNFFCLPVLADTDREQPFNIDASGMIHGTQVPFLSAPGLAAACNIMGANVTPKFAQQVLQALPQNANGITVLDVIGACAKVVVQNQGGDKPTLVALGKFAFSSLTSNPIMRSVEAAFAAMAEDRASDSTRGNINNCIAQALASTWQSLNSDPRVGAFQTAFFNLFNASYRLVYNPDVPLPQVSADGSSEDGAFWLYRRNLKDPNCMGVRVISPQDLRKLVLDAVAEASVLSGSTAISNAVTQYVKDDAFLRAALWAYDPANKQENYPVANYKKLSRTPMQSPDGDNPFEVDDIDTGKSFDSSVQNHTVANAQDLLTWCLGMAKTVAPGLSPTRELFPMDSPQHAFHFVPGNPDLATYAQNGKNPSDWIRQGLMIPGMKISTRTMDSQTASALNNGVYQYLSNAIPNQSDYNAILPEGQSLTVQQYAQALVDGINKYLGSNADQASEVGTLVDVTLLQVLPTADAATLEQTAIKFAFTNWNDGVKDIYFCGYFNPRTQTIGFGTIDEDKTNLQPMQNADAWVTNQQWDVDLTPKTPAA